MPGVHKTPAQLRGEIAAHLDDFPDQLLALESAMEEFGDDFGIKGFKLAFEKKSGLKAYNQVQAVERALTRVQNYIVNLAQAGAMLAGLELPNTHEGTAGRTLVALKEANVINASLCRRLQRAQKARSTIEHEYVQVKGGSVHEAAGLVHECARDFIGP